MGNGHGLNSSVKVRVDPEGNVVFPHHVLAGLSARPTALFFLQRRMVPGTGAEKCQERALFDVPFITHF